MSKEFIEQQIETDLKFLDKNREVITTEKGGVSSTRIRQVLENIDPVYVRTRPRFIGDCTYAMHLANVLREEIAREQADNERHRQKEGRKESDLKYPFRSKYSEFKERRQQLPDHNFKHYTKGLLKPSFSFEPGAYQADLMVLGRDGYNETKGYILFLINVNTKYVYTKQLAKKDINSVQHAFQSAVKKIKAAGLPIISIASDAETSFQSDMVAGGIKIRSSGSPHTNHVRIVDRLMRTFRDALGVDADNNLFEDYSMVKKLVEYYNKTPHKSLRMYGKAYTPHEVQSDVDLEWVYIRNKIRKLQEVRHNLMNKGLMGFEPGNILQCALSHGKSRETFNKRRRVFDKLAMFIRYHNGNAVIRILHPLSSEEIDVPLYRCMYLCKSFADLLNTSLGKQVVNTFNCDLGVIANHIDDELHSHNWL